MYLYKLTSNWQQALRSIVWKQIGTKLIANLCVILFDDSKLYVALFDDKLAAGIIL